ncbi:FCS-Like Zinc finger 13-like [Gossypium arboreum]|uniref:FLZ-type domain-containing protein n=1 Tax=Gossypium arboreum TaxID=29729 RepID=A0ABR0PK86_GOSAR|nr:FCS-Like Zinc finger 13-like [Gossypium arboreum]KAK5824839.1 hypothetical protein PVK06_019623 [Gossypium arboreum]
MSGKRPRPMMGKLSELLVAGKKPVFLDAVVTSPRSPLDLKTPSPRSSKRYDVGGVGLGIAVALDNKCSTHSCRHTICSSNVIVVKSGGKNLEMESLEDFTYVTTHGSGKSSTKVYYDGGEERRKSNCETPAPAPRFVEEVAYPTSDFLSCCHLCRKKLHGQDIYMYRGEKAFCSSECRSTQIMMDERKEQCRSEVSRSARVTTSSYESGDIFFSTGILAI